MKSVIISSLVLYCLILCAASISEADESSSNSISSGKSIRISVSIPPLKFFAEQIGGSRVDVEVLLPPGQSPATYELTPKQMTRLNDVDFIFTIGVPFEKILVSKLAGFMDESKLIDTGRRIKLRSADFHHESNRHDSHDHRILDPHIWLDPLNAKDLARAVCEELIKFDSSGKTLYEDNLRRLNLVLDNLNEKINAILKPLNGQSFFVYHPAYGYFADAYGLKQIPVEIEGKEPTALQLAKLIDLGKKEKIKAIFIQPQFSSSSAEIIADEIGSAVIEFDPLAEDYIKNLEYISKKLAESLRE